MICSIACAVELQVTELEETLQGKIRDMDESENSNEKLRKEFEQTSKVLRMETLIWHASHRASYVWIIFKHSLSLRVHRDSVRGSHVRSE